MAVETEVKVRVTAEELQTVRKRLENWGIEWLGRRYEVNDLFDDPEGSLKKAGCALRLRTTDSKALLTFKGKRQQDPDFKKRPEFETQVGDPHAVRKILEALGLGACFRYEKHREVCRWPLESGVVEVCLDETVVGNFVEIEGKPESILQAAGRLGWGPERFITQSYVELFSDS